MDPMPDLNQKFSEILDKYTPDPESLSEEQVDELAHLAIGFNLALKHSRSINEGDLDLLKKTLSLFTVVFEMGKRSSHGIELHVESEPFGSYKEANLDGTHYGIELLTPSQVDVRNHINEVAGLERRWVPA